MEKEEWTKSVEIKGEKRHGCYSLGWRGGRYFGLLDFGSGYWVRNPADMSLASMDLKALEWISNLLSGF